jgi:hypothetical protein
MSLLLRIASGHRACGTTFLSGELPMVTPSLFLHVLESCATVFAADSSVVSVNTDDFGTLDRATVARLLPRVKEQARAEQAARESGELRAAAEAALPPITELLGVCCNACGSRDAKLSFWQKADGETVALCSEVIGCDVRARERGGEPGRLASGAKRVRPEFDAGAMYRVRCRG